ncbi:MAG: hypothetical protein J5J06_02625 [Phycisphaerae bacterium]|nr:hypothetical protein [Phycisphaerae bacterium]
MQWMTVAGGLLMALTVAAGCNQNASGPAVPPVNGGEGHADHAEHAHATVGPHGGDLIELGNEEYHAELLHDERAGTVTIYILDAHAKAAVPIDATELTINLKHDGQAEQFKLAASPDAGDPPGESSRFTSSDAELGEDLEHEGAEPQLVVTINGKQYRGKIEHGDHGHEGGHKH